MHANYANGPAEIRRIAVCSGGGPRYLPEVAASGCDAFLTGDLFEPAEMWSRELGVHFLAAGHYATEVFGVQALAELISAELDCAAEFIDLPTNALATVGASGFDNRGGLPRGRHRQRASEQARHHEDRQRGAQGQNRC